MATLDEYNDLLKWHAIAEQERTFIGTTQLIVLYYLIVWCIITFITSGLNGFFALAVVLFNYLIYVGIYKKVAGFFFWSWPLMCLLRYRIVLQRSYLEDNKLPPNACLEIMDFVKTNSWLYYFNHGELIVSRKVAMKAKLIINHPFTVNKKWFWEK